MISESQTVSKLKVSIIMPSYNAEKTIKASINSVIAQTFVNWELIIIDDASQDGTVSAIKEQKDPRIILLENAQNSGAAEARNCGINHAKGQWLAFLDSDDLWHEDKLQKQIQFMEETGAVISYTATAYMSEAGEISGYILRAEKQLSYKELLKRNLMSCSSVMVRRDVMRRDTCTKIMRCGCKL
jgi:teichuronic acid biosynthesis glycosyltransferase TuaG